MMQVGCGGGGHDVCIGRINPAVAQVFTNGCMEQQAFLKDDTDLATQRHQVDVA